MAGDVTSPFFHWLLMRPARPAICFSSVGSKIRAVRESPLRATEQQQQQHNGSVTITVNLCSRDVLACVWCLTSCMYVTLSVLLGCSNCCRLALLHVYSVMCHYRRSDMNDADKAAVSAFKRVAPRMTHKASGDGAANVTLTF